MVCGDVFVLHRSMGRLCSVVESRCHARGHVLACFGMPRTSIPPYLI